MQQAPTQFPFTRIYYAQQPFGVRVRCILDSSLISKRPLITGLAIEATGAMQVYFGLGPFTRNKVKDFGQPLGYFLGNLDRQGGTSIIYWGTNDPGTIQSLGFRKASDWSSFSFSPPSSGYGRENSLDPALDHFFSNAYLNDRKLDNHDQEGVLIFLLDGPIDDYAKVSDYIGQMTQDMIANHRKKRYLIFVGIGESFIQTDQGQIQALVSYSGATDPPIISSLVVPNPQDLVERVEDALMYYYTVGRSGSLLNEKGGILREYPDGLPGAFQFYIPSGSSGFSIDLDGTIYSQKIPT